MESTWLYAIGGVALLALILAAKALARGSASEAAPTAVPAPAPSGGGAGYELVAVIAAAVAASSDMAPGSFRVASIEAVPGSCAGSGGFNTPIWGHVDRLVRAQQNR